MIINDALKMLRTIDGATGKELAQALGISTSYLSEIENGKKQPSYDLLEKYSIVFDIKLSTLILFTEETKEDSTFSLTRTKTRDTLFRFMKFINKMENPKGNE